MFHGGNFHTSIVMKDEGKNQRSEGRGSPNFLLAHFKSKVSEDPLDLPNNRKAVTNFFGEVRDTPRTNKQKKLTEKATFTQRLKCAQSLQEPKRIVKDWRYFRRTGAVWTDLYHTPPGRLHLTAFRPDLDKKHEDFVASRVAEEKKRERRKRHHQMRRIELQRRHMWSRRSQNRNVDGWAKNKDKVLSPNGRSEILKKDWRFYRRTGNLWTDLNNVPKKRIHLIVTENCLKGDTRAIKHIKNCMTKEWQREDEHSSQQILRAGEIRRHFQNRIMKREALERRLYKKESVRRPQTSTVTISKIPTRLEELARPKSARPRDTRALDHLSSRDFSGLLYLDPVCRRNHPYSKCRAQTAPQESKRESGAGKMAPEERKSARFSTNLRSRYKDAVSAGNIDSERRSARAIRETIRDLDEFDATKQVTNLQRAPSDYEAPAEWLAHERCEEIPPNDTNVRSRRRARQKGRSHRSAPTRSFWKFQDEIGDKSK